jgi:hypothetical protein
MAKRYGWTFDYILSLPFLSFMDYIDILNIGLKEDFTDNMTLHAFGSWQIIEALKGMLGGNKSKSTSFADYAKSLNLIEKEKDDKTKQIVRKAEKEEALKTAQNIIQLHKKGAKKVND